MTQQIHTELTDTLWGESLELAKKSIKDGYVIVAPLENGYALLADAFSHDAVRALHVLRGDALGVASQVLIADASRIDGIARDISEDARKLMKLFWPGLLSLTLKPQRALTWDLGDNGKLDKISVRVPKAPFILQLLEEYGPLAVASASRFAQPAITNPAQIDFSINEVAAIFTTGILPQGKPSTVVECDLMAARITREGEISVDELTSQIEGLGYPS